MCHSPFQDIMALPAAKTAVRFRAELILLQGLSWSVTEHARDTGLATAAHHRTALVDSLCSESPFELAETWSYLLCSLSLDPWTTGGGAPASGMQQGLSASQA